MRALCLGILIVLCAGRATAQDAPRPVAVWVDGYGPLLPSEWRAEVLPAARRALGAAHPEWQLIVAEEVARLEAEADSQAGADGGATLRDLVARAHPHGTTFALQARCDEDRCTVTGSSPDLEVGATWELPFSIRARAWARALSSQPRSQLMGFGRGVGGRGFSVGSARGRWSEADVARVTSIVRAIAWPAACAVDRAVVLDLVLEVRRDGTFGEIGASGGPRYLVRCVERGVIEALGEQRVGRARRLRRLELLAIGRP